MKKKHPKVTTDVDTANTMLLETVVNLPPDICHHSVAQELECLRSVCTSPDKRGVACLPLLALFSQNETSQIKPFIHNSFQRLPHLARNGLRIVQKNSHRPQRLF